MVCPQCRQPLTEKGIITSDNQETTVFECFNCGGHFIPPLIANLILQNTAQNLDSITPKNTYPVTPSTVCPICQADMVSIVDGAVPRGVTVYSCPENHGNFFPLHQLFAFKRAQKTKLEYHQLWGIPVKSIFTILLPLIAIFTAVTAIPFTLQQIKSIQESRIKAGELVSNPLVSSISPTQVVISFSTRARATSSLTLLLPDDTKKDFVGSTKPQKNHLVNLTDLRPNTHYRYNLIINGRTYGPYDFTTSNK